MVLKQNFWENKLFKLQLLTSFVEVVLKFNRLRSTHDAKVKTMILLAFATVAERAHSLRTCEKDTKRLRF